MSSRSCSSRRRARRSALRSPRTSGSSKGSGRSCTPDRLSARSGMASGRRRLDPHVDGRRRGASADRRGGAASERDDARRAAPRRGQTGDDGVRGWTDPIAGHEAAGVPTATHVLDRLNVTRWTVTTFAVRCWGSSGITSAGRSQVAEAGWRRRVPAAGGESGSGAAGASRGGGLRRPRRASRLLGRWTGSSTAPARSACSTRRPAAAHGRHLLDLGIRPAPKWANC